MVSVPSVVKSWGVNQVRFLAAEVIPSPQLIIVGTGNFGFFNSEIIVEGSNDGKSRWDSTARC